MTEKKQMKYVFFFKYKSTPAPRIVVARRRPEENQSPEFAFWGASDLEHDKNESTV